MEQRISIPPLRYARVTNYVDNFRDGTTFCFDVLKNMATAAKNKIQGFFTSFRMTTPFIYLFYYLI
jgi:hypothetical protein